MGAIKLPAFPWILHRTGIFCAAGKINPATLNSSITAWPGAFFAAAQIQGFQSVAAM